MRKVLFLFSLLFIVSLVFGQEGYPAGYFYMIYRGDTMCVEPVITDSTTEAVWFDFTSASMHTGLETAYESHLFFFYNPMTGNIGMVYQHNIDEVGTEDATAMLYLDDLPVGCSVALSDDASEFSLSAYPQGNWHWWNNTDGCAWYIPRDEWQFTLRMQWGSLDPIRSYWFISGDEGEDRIRLDTVYIDQEDSLIVGHGFLQALHYGDPDYGDSVLVGTSVTYGIPLCNSTETIDTLRIGSVHHTNPTNFVIGDDYDSWLDPGECTGFEVDFFPTSPGIYYDTLFFIYNNPCDSVESIIVKRIAVEPQIIPEFMEETECDGRNMVELCWTMIGASRTPFDGVRIEISSDGGDSWDVPIATISDFEGDLGDDINPGYHCINWDVSEDLPDYESCNINFRVIAGVPGIAHLKQTTYEDFSSGELVNIDILTPDPDGEDDGALWVIPGSDTIKVLQVYPNGHCTDCMSDAIYTYMGTGDPVLNIKIYLMQMTEFNGDLSSGLDSSPLTVSYIDPTGVIHTSEEIALLNFDVVMFGVADSYGGTPYDISPAASDALVTYASRGKGLLFSHDTIGCSSGHCMDGFCALSEISGISCIEVTSWASFTSVTRVGGETLSLLSAPFEIPETFPVLNCHWKGQVIEDGWFLYQGVGSPVSSEDNLLYWQSYHNTEYNSFSSFYSYGHVEATLSEWEAKAMINSIYYSYHGGIGTGVYTSDPVDFEGGARLVDVLWSVEIPHCGGSVTVEIAADTCIGESECWTAWLPVEIETPEIPMFDRIRYRIGMTGRRESECDSPILHWFTFDIMDSTTVIGEYDGCLDTWAPRVSISCPSDTLPMYDTITFNWEIEDIFFVNDPCSVFIEYCGETDVFYTSDSSIDWIVPERFCDSTWVNLRVAARDSFCNWGEASCETYCMPIWFVELGLEPEIACAGDTILIPITIDSLDYGWINSFELALKFDEEILIPMNVLTGGFTEGWTIEDIVVEPDSAFLSFELSNPVSIIAGTGGILVYIRAYVPLDAGSGEFAALEISHSNFNSGNPIATHNPATFVTCVMPEAWIGNLRLNNSKEVLEELLLVIGVTSAASEGYDPGLDLLILPTTPGDINAWIEIDDPLYPGVSRLVRNFKDINPPKTWIIPTNDETDGIVRWSPEEMPLGKIMLNGIYDMRVDSFAYFELNDTLVITWSLPIVEIAEIDFYAGWNLISMPVVPVSADASEIFEFSPVSPFAYDSHARLYFMVEEMQSGIGYWVWSPSDTSIEIAGMPIDTFNTDIYPAWNLIGASGVLTDVISTCTSPADIVVGSIYGYEAGAYVTADSFDPTKGYWLLSSNFGVFSNPSGGEFCKILPIGMDKAIGKLISGDTEIEFGISTWASDGLDVFDRANPPTPPQTSTPQNLTFISDGLSLNRDISASGNWEIDVPENISIHVEIPENIEALSIDNISVYDGEIVYLTQGLHKMSAQTPVSCYISGAYPNPFNSSIEISISSNHKDGVIEIFDVLGNKIQTISFSGTSAIWNGFDTYGYEVSSGVYMLRLKTNEIQDIKRIMLIK